MPDEQKNTPPTSGNNTGMAVICYFGVLVLIPLLTDAKNDPFIKFHIKQGLVLLIAGIINMFIFWIPFLGWIVSILLFILFIIGILNALNGKQEPLPVIGTLGKNFNV